MNKIKEPSFKDLVDPEKLSVYEKIQMFEALSKPKTESVQVICPPKNIERQSNDLLEAKSVKNHNEEAKINDKFRISKQQANGKTKEVKQIDHNLKIEIRTISDKEKIQSKLKNDKNWEEYQYSKITPNDERKESSRIKNKVRKSVTFEGIKKELNSEVISNKENETINHHNLENTIHPIKDKEKVQSNLKNDKNWEEYQYSKITPNDYCNKSSKNRKELRALITTEDGRKEKNYDLTSNREGNKVEKRKDAKNTELQKRLNINAIKLRIFINGLVLRSLYNKYHSPIEREKKRNIILKKLSQNDILTEK